MVRFASIIKRYLTFTKCFIHGIVYTKQIYSHLIIKKIDVMIADILTYIDVSNHKMLNLSGCYNSLEEFARLQIIY